MSIITSLSFESNLGFTFDRQATAADTTLYLKFYNRITGVATEPIAANRTNLIIVADKGSEGSPNLNYEIIVLGTVGAASGGVSTCTSCVRGITFSTTAITAGSGGKIHQAGSIGGCADVADLWWQVYRVMDGTYGTNANNLRVGAEAAADVSFYVQNDQTVKPRLYFDDSDKRFKISWGDDAPAAGDVDGVGVPQLTTTERDALTWPAGGGQVIYNTTLGYTQFREGGTWVSNVSGATVADASTTVAGKVEEATTTDMGAGTATGATGARLFVNSGNLVKTSSGAGDENKLAVLNSSGQFATGFMPTNVQEANTFFGATDITGAEAELLTDGSDASTKHIHGSIGLLKSLNRSFLSCNGGSGVTSGSGGEVVTHYAGLTLLTSGNSDGSYAGCGIDTNVGRFGATFDTKSPEAFFSVRLQQTSAQDAFIGFGMAQYAVGTDGVYTTDHAAFLIDDATLYASVADGATQTKSAAITGITLTDRNNYFIDTSGGHYRFYVNNVLKYTSTANEPNSGFNTASCCIRSREAALKYLSFSGWVSFTL